MERKRKSIPRGFDKGIVDSDPVDSKFLCGICNCILQKPMQGFCGHRFCDACVSYRLEVNEEVNSKYCPACIKDVGNDELKPEHLLEQLYVDNAMKRDAAKVGVHCINMNCTWKGNLRQYDDHERSCKHKRLECICGLLIPLSDEKKHLTAECEMRKTNCLHCERLLVFKMLKGHLEECLMVPFDCSYCGKKNILRKHEVNHYSGECKVKMIRCKICLQMITENKVNQHMEKSIMKHLEKVNDKINDVAIELHDNIQTLSSSSQESEEKLEKVTSELSRIEKIKASLEKGSLNSKGTENHAGAHNTISAASGDVVRQKDTGIRNSMAAAAADSTGAASASGGTYSVTEVTKQLDDLRQRVSVFENIGSVLNNEVMEIAVKIDQYDTRLGGSSGLHYSETEELKAKVRQLEQDKMAQGRRIEELNLRLEELEKTSYDGTLIWKITDVERKRSEARSGTSGSIYSPPFYTSRSGYKMCARLYLSGDGMGRNTHMSLYFVVMKGEFDNLLRWPFKQKVTLTLLDFNRREHVSDSFRPDPASTSFLRPQTKMNIASGCPLFCQLTRLNKPGSSCYINEDTMYIKVMVDLTDL